MRHNSVCMKTYFKSLKCSQQFSSARKIGHTKMQLASCTTETKIGAAKQYDRCASQSLLHLLCCSQSSTGRLTMGFSLLACLNEFTATQFIKSAWNKNWNGMFVPFHLKTVMTVTSDTILVDAFPFLILCGDTNHSFLCIPGVLICLIHSR